ncbi:MAG: ABC transporter ATP-binding protein [Humidesulfovibrio sp.]|uniref:ABC transporter ATP-binding protein n=1 Tax=Humidesulfovibrio sp. TaxID=2910988 RepID=UPI0027FE58FD|nr:ABC transporter ATP-binding protein [Humidesulfovibrio sp.]MDQ7834045.1 ABC transporter ATP-binding protein [Humidesulfovibrio sp.]
MKELFRRLALRPRLAWEILFASFLANLMSVASSIYVILVLNRYIGYGFDGTLYTLTTGVLIASILGTGFASVRGRLASAVSVLPDHELNEKTLTVFTRARLTALYRMPTGRHQEMLTALKTVEFAYDSNNISAILDAPFLLLFLLAIAFIHPLLAVITVLAIIATIIFTLSSMRANVPLDERQREQGIAHRNLTLSAVAGAETVRAFLGGDFLRKAWRKQMQAIQDLREVMENARDRSKTRLETVSMLLRVSIYFFGAMLAVVGEMSVGGLIGASILSAKAMQMSTSFLQSHLAGQKAEEALLQLGEFHSMPLEPVSGSAVREFSGRLELRDVGFAYSGSTGPVFESLSFTLPPGAILAVSGFNGSGKSTFCKLVAGLLEPGRGHVLADGIELRQFAPDWWRRQLLYLPQEPTFLNATIRENITLAELEPDSPATQERLNQAVRAAALRRFLDVSRQGLDMEIAEGGRTLPVGIRRRIALARALMNQGRLVVFDDPTEGLDSEGCLAVYNVLNALAKVGATIIVATVDQNILKGATYVLDMNEKPTPTFTQVREPKAEEGA